jgi:beta-glucosidase
MTTSAVDSASPPYRDPTLTLDERVADLLARMTTEEKVAQLGSRWVFELAGDDGQLDARADELLANGLGQVTRISGASSLRPMEAATLANGIQRHLLEKTRLGIPAIVHEEICSGLMARDATVFPQAIGLASMWDPVLVEALADAIRVQMRATGAHQGLGPVLDVCRDPRWGRTEETFGEDPHLVAQIGLAFVRGLQGDDARHGVIATAKHFVGYGASEGGKNWAPAQIPPRELHDVYLHPFAAAIACGGVRSVMNAYNEIDGVPCTADRSLLTLLLRGELGFNGFVVADYFSIRQLVDYHRFAVDAADAAVQTLEAGLDVELPSTDCYGAPLFAALEEGRVSEAVLDEAVGRVLRAKFELGLFEQPFVDVAEAPKVSGTSAHRELARRTARKSIVLLRNDGALPLREQAGSVAVIGPNAAAVRSLFGDYAYPAHVESLAEVLESGRDVFSVRLLGGRRIEAGAIDAPGVLDALRERLGTGVRYARGCDVDGSGREGFEEAVALARDSRMAIMVMGDKSGLTDDCSSGETRDRASLDLPGVQEELVRAVLETGTPVVLVLVAGRPIGSVWIHERCAAVLLAWLPGEEGGRAIADALVGAANPGGKLPISFPRTVGQLPVFYGHKVSGGRSHWKEDYVDAPVRPLYPFGYGLSYTRFALSGPSVSAGRVSWSDTIEVEVTVANVGSRTGDEVVQLYSRDVYASVTRPVLELKGFLRVELAPSESRRVTFGVPASQLGFHGRELSYVVEPGPIEFFVGTSSADLLHAGTIEVVSDDGGLPAKAYEGWTTLE